MIPLDLKHAGHPIAIDSRAPAFDKLSFVKYMKNIGREYRKQAIGILSICRNISREQKQTRSSYDELRRYYSQIILS
jgi:hypothetical protein